MFISMGLIYMDLFIFYQLILMTPKSINLHYTPVVTVKSCNISSINEDLFLDFISVSVSFYYSLEY